MVKSNRYFYLKDIDCTITVDICSAAKDILCWLKGFLETFKQYEKADKYTKKCFADVLIDECFMILYKDGSEKYISFDFYDGEKIKMTNIKSMVYVNAENYMVYGNFEMSETGAIIPAADETIIDDTNIIEVATNNYHETSEAPENIISINQITKINVSIDTMSIELENNDIIIIDDSNINVYSALINQYTELDTIKTVYDIKNARRVYTKYNYIAADIYNDNTGFIRRQLCGYTFSVDTDNKHYIANENTLEKVIRYLINNHYDLNGVYLTVLYNSEYIPGFSELEFNMIFQGGAEYVKNNYTNEFKRNLYDNTPEVKYLFDNCDSIIYYSDTNTVEFFINESSNDTEYVNIDNMDISKVCEYNNKRYTEIHRKNTRRAALPDQPGAASENTSLIKRVNIAVNRYLSSKVPHYESDTPINFLANTYANNFKEYMCIYDVLMSIAEMY